MNHDAERVGAVTGGGSPPTDGPLDPTSEFLAVAATFARALATFGTVAGQPFALTPAEIQTLLSTPFAQVPAIMPALTPADSPARIVARLVGRGLIESHTARDGAPVWTLSLHGRATVDDLSRRFAVALHDVNPHLAAEAAAVMNAVAAHLGDAARADRR